MLSTFHGLETARRGMVTQQSALHTTGHNVANANTEGYTRQRVNMQQTQPYPPASMNRPNIPGQLGSGVEAGSVERIREQFLDVQYRNENNKTGYWDTRLNSLEKMESIMNEPSEHGLSNTMDRFWQSLQDLEAQPDDPGARTVVRQRGQAVAETFSYMTNALEETRKDFGKEIEVAEKEINSLTRQINNLNKQISGTEAHGYVTNDLYDERDLLIDRLSGLVNIKTDRVATGGNQQAAAEGLVSVRLVDEVGQDLNPPVVLVDAKNHEATKGVKVNYNDETGAVESLGFGTLNGSEVTDESTTVEADSFKSNGELKAFVEAFGYAGGENEVRGLYPEMLTELDEMAFRFATEFNHIHESGWSINEINNGKSFGTGTSFFRDAGNDAHLQSGKLTFNEEEDKAGFAGRLALAKDIVESVDNIAAAGAATNEPRKMNYNGDAEEVPKNQPVIRGAFAGYKNEAGENVDQLDIQVAYADGAWSYEANGEEAVEFTPPTASLHGLTIDVSQFKFAEEGEAHSWELNDIEVGVKDAAFSGDGSNASQLANIKDETFAFKGNTANVQSFYRSVIGDLAVDTEESRRFMKNSETLKANVEKQRESVSSVSLDEEMTNMIKFQHAYNAAARNITAIDEMLDKIINGMGVVGR